MNDKSLDKLYIYNNYLDLVYYSYNILKKYPKYEKDVLCKEIRSCLLNIYKNIVYAYDESNLSNKISYLKYIYSDIKVIEFYIRISYKEKYISSSNYSAWSKKINNVSKHLNNWIISCQRRLK